MNLGSCTECKRYPVVIHQTGPEEFCCNSCVQKINDELINALRKRTSEKVLNRLADENLKKLFPGTS